MAEEWTIDPKYKETFYDEDAYPLEPLDDHDMPIRFPDPKTLVGRRIEAAEWVAGIKGMPNHITGLRLKLNDGRSIIIGAGGEEIGMERES